MILFIHFKYLEAVNLICMKTLRLELYEAKKEIRQEMNSVVEGMKTTL